MGNILIMRNIFKINIFTYLFFLLYILSGFYKDIIIIYFILFVHELGHYFMMKYYNIDVNSITFYPYGGMIKSNMLVNTNSFKVLIISLGGIFSQIVVLIVFFLLYKFNIIYFNIYNIFVRYNFYIILFNLLPMYPLDGFKIFGSLLELFISFKKSIFFSLIINVLCLIMFLFYLYIYDINNYVIIVFLLVSMFNFIREMKFILNKFYLERIIYEIEYNGMISVNSLDDIYKNKFNYIKTIGEYEFLKDKYKYLL